VAEVQKPDCVMEQIMVMDVGIIQFVLIAPKFNWQHMHANKLATVMAAKDLNNEKNSNNNHYWNHGAQFRK
jgi:hypothetical protein